MIGRWRLAALAALLATGCGGSTAYVPAASPCLSRIMEDGHTRWMHDGVTFRNLDEAIAESPAATSLLRRAERRGRTGEALMWTGLVAMTASAAHVAMNDEIGPADNAVAAVGLGLGFASLWLFSAARRDLLDAHLTYDNEKCR